MSALLAYKNIFVMCLLSNKHGIKKCTCKFRDACVQRFKTERMTENSTTTSGNQGAVVVSCSNANMVFEVLTRPMKKDAIALTSF